MKKVLPRLILPFLWFIVLIQFLLRFQGLQHQGYRDQFNYILDHSLYPNDFLVTKSIFYDASIIYKILHFLHLDMTNDLVGIGPYLLFGSLSLFVVYLILQDYFKPKDQLEFLIYIFALIFGAQKFLPTVESSLFLGNFPTPTWFAHILSFLFIYTLLKNRIFIAAILLTLTLAVLVKVHWILLPIFIFYIFLNKDLKKQKLLYVAIPIAFILFKLKTSVSLPTDPAEILKMIENIIRRDSFEDALNLMPFHSILLFAASFFIFHFLIKKIADVNFKSLAKAVFWVSLLSFVFMTLYTWKIYLYFPQPFFFLISPPRAQEIYSMFLILLMTGWILNQKKFNPVQKILFLLALFTFRADQFSFVIFSLSLTVIAVILGSSRFSFFKLKQDYHLVFPTIFCLLLSVITFKPIYSKRNILFNKSSFVALKSWTMRPLESDLFQTLLTIRNQKEDFILLVFEKDFSQNSAVRISYDTYGNFIARKSKFSGDSANVYTNNELFELAEKRSEKADLISRFLNKEIASITDEQSLLLESTWSELKMLKAYLLLPDSDLLPTLPGQQTVLKILIILIE